MKFVVHGVDRNSGQETSLSLSAANAAEAESIASLSMLVAEVKVDQTPVQSVPYAQPNMDAGFDWPAGIVTQVRLLRLLSWVVAGLGTLGLMSALVLLSTVMIESTALNKIQRWLGTVAVADFGGAISLLTLACLMRLAAHFLLGLRELLLQKIDRQK